MRSAGQTRECPLHRVSQPVISSHTRSGSSSWVELLRTRRGTGFKPRLPLQCTGVLPAIARLLEQPAASNGGIKRTRKGVRIDLEFAPSFPQDRRSPADELSRSLFFGLLLRVHLNDYPDRMVHQQSNRSASRKSHVVACDHRRIR